jgi:hypothetical protein
MDHTLIQRVTSKVTRTHEENQSGGKQERGGDQ